MKPLTKTSERKTSNENRNTKPVRATMEGTDMANSVPGGSLRLADNLVPSRMGFGAMQLAGPRVFGPPADRDQALAVLREAVNLGVTHIDTSDFYGPFVVNELIREALYPYPADLRIITKVGARRGEDGSWHPALDPADLRVQVHQNLERLGVDTLDANGSVKSE